VGEDWSADEVAAIVADYRSMLQAELRGAPYNKSEHRRQLLARLGARTEGAIEFKHANISAVLIEMGFPFIEGYKQRVNVQDRLRREVEEQISSDRELHSLAEHYVTAPAASVRMKRDFDSVLVPAPSREHEAAIVYTRPNAAPSPRNGVDYLALESRNRSLGLAGEEFVLEFERQTLIAAGKRKLAERIEHVANTRGDGLGYDILSFDQTGRERLIEVKTTGLGIRTPFFASRREVTVSEQMADQFHLYRVFGFRRSAKLFVVSGALSASCLLDPVQYKARVL
jgi:hypothetical protein